MIRSPNGYAAVALVAALVPAVVGVYAWRRRGKPGAVPLALLLWLFALWGLL